MPPSIENLARATGKDADELAHLLACPVCTPVVQCDRNPSLIRAAIAAFRGTPGAALAGAGQQHVRVNARGEVEVGDVEEYRRIREAHVGRPLDFGAADPRKA